MRVGIDAYVLGAQNGGDASYVRDLIRTLTTVDPRDDYILFSSRALPEEAICDGSHMRSVAVRPGLQSLYFPFALPLALERERVDVLHVQYMAPLYPIPIVVTVHDISYERYPQFFPPGLVMQLRTLVPWTIRRAAAVLTVSEFSRQDMVRRYRVPPEKITVAHGGPQALFRPLHDEGGLAAVREHYSAGQRFILCVGNLQPRKNLRTLIEAYVRLRRSDAIRHKLVLVGRRGWLSDNTFTAARDSGFVDDLIFTDYVPDEELVRLYNAADLFVYPSIFEGLGLPPLEAMACGTPVVTSNTSSLPEVVDDAALMVDPLDVEALATAIVSVLSDSDLRERLASAGPRRVAAFSWEKATRAIVDVYHSVASR